jgi:hypothetical protein
MQSEGEPQRGLSASAWAALAAIGAAVVTGGVTLLTHFLPAAEPGSASLGAATSVGSSVPSTTVAGLVGTATPTSSAPPVTSEALRQFVGTWSGPASDGSVSGTLTLTVLPSCTIGGPCGTMVSTLYGCQWDIDLVTIRDGPQLRVATVRLASGDPGACALHPPGDDFQVGRGQLVYSTGYDSSTQGLLTKMT